MNFKVILKPHKFMGNYFGMNHEAGKELHNKTNPATNVLYIDKSLSKSEQSKVIVHEKIEDYMMRVKHLKYNKAHKIANAFEGQVHTPGFKTAKVKAFEKKYNY